MLSVHQSSKLVVLASAFAILGGCGGDDAPPGPTPDAAVMPEASTPDGSFPDSNPCADVDCSAMTDMCNTGTCNPATGACEAVPMMDGAMCDDADACTSGDMCTAGTCAGAAMDCSAMSDMCNTGMCDPATGACAAVPMMDGVMCDDTDACTSGDMCTAGACAGAEMDCTAMTDMCNTGMCDPTIGACAAVPVVDGTMCDDMDAGTSGDICTDGMCAGTTSGHLVLIGHDYFLREANADLIVGNAVLLANTMGTINVVVYQEHADVSGEVTRTRAAIDSVLAMSGRTATYTTLMDDAALDLSSAHVLLIPEQENGSETQLTAVGAGWNAALNTFLDAGGVVVACDYNGSRGGTWRTVAGTGLLSPSGVNNVTGEALSVVDATSPLTAGVAAAGYSAPNGSLSFTGMTGGSTVIAHGMAPVVLHLTR